MKAKGLKPPGQLSARARLEKMTVEKYTVEELSTMLQVSTSTVRNYLRDSERQAFVPRQEIRRRAFNEAAASWMQESFGYPQKVCGDILSRALRIEIAYGMDLQITLRRKKGLLELLKMIDDNPSKLLPCSGSKKSIPAYRLALKRIWQYHQTLASPVK